MPCRKHVWEFVTLLALLGASPGLWSIERGFRPVSAEELAMKSEPLAPGAPAIILFREVDRDDKNGHQYSYYRIKILTEEGRKYADIEIPYFDKLDHLKDLKARTIRPDGSIVNFEGKPFEKTVVKARGLKYLAKTFTLPDVQVGSIIEYYYELNSEGGQVYASRWVISDELFTKHAQFSLSPFHQASGWGLHYVPKHMPPGATPVQGKDHTIHLEISNVPAMAIEDFMPPLGEVQTSMEFIYQPERDSNTQEFWNDIGKELNSELEKFIGKRDAMQQVVSQIVAPTDPPELKLQKIYARVQQLRNTSYEEEKTKQEEKRADEKSPSNAADLWRRGYGDGQQLTFLFVALARAAGLEAYGAWGAARDRYFFQPDNMEYWALDANLADVVVNGQDRFFDPGCAFAPFGVLPWAETGVTALRLDQTGGKWVRVPVPNSSVSRTERIAHLKIDDSGDLEGTLTLKYTGLEALERRQEERNEDDVERKKFLEDEVKTLVPVGVELELTNQPAWNSSVDPLEADFRMKVPSWLSETGRRALLPVGLFSAQDKHVFEHTNRVHPIYMKYNAQVIDDVTLELPPGWKAGDLPQKQLSGGNAVSYEMKFDSTKDQLHMRRKLQVDFLIMDSKYYAALRNFYQAVASSDDAQIVLQTATTAASN